MTDRSNFLAKKRTSSITEIAPHEINRTTREKNFKTLEDIKRDHFKDFFLAADNVRDFLQDTTNSVNSEEGKLLNDAQRLEKRIMKQEYLINNNLFNPTEYFGGLEISDLDENTVDQRLEDMFLYYVPTEMEEAEDAKQQQKTQSDKTQNAYSSKASTKKQNSNVLKDVGLQKNEMMKGPVKVFPETTKKKQDVLGVENLLSEMLNSQLKVKGENEKNCTNKVLPTKLKCQQPNMVNLKQKVTSPVAVSQEVKLPKKERKNSTYNKENKIDGGEPGHIRNKKSVSVTKSQTLFEHRAQNEQLLDYSTTPSVQKSMVVNTSLVRNNRPRAQGASNMHHNRSFNTTRSNNNTFHHYKTNSLSKQAYNENMTLREDANQEIRLMSTKVETLSTGRSKTKSTDRNNSSNKEMKNIRRIRKDRKNFSSFTGGLSTEEEPEFLFKSYNAASRPKTANPFAVDDTNYVLKGILSPKINKSLISKKGSKGHQKVQKSIELKPQGANPLKFLNDLLNKRKISYGSSDHLRMPKKPTFLESKVSSPVAQIMLKHPKATPKNDVSENKIAPVAVYTQGVGSSNNRFGVANCPKKMFTIKL